MSGTWYPRLHQQIEAEQRLMTGSWTDDEFDDASTWHRLDDEIDALAALRDVPLPADEQPAWLS